MSYDVRRRHTAQKAPTRKSYHNKWTRASQPPPPPQSGTTTTSTNNSNSAPQHQWQRPSHGSHLKGPRQFISSSIQGQRHAWKRTSAAISSSSTSSERPKNDASIGAEDHQDASVTGTSQQKESDAVLVRRSAVSRGILDRGGDDAVVVTADGDTTTRDERRLCMTKVGKHKLIVGGDRPSTRAGTVETSATTTSSSGLMKKRGRNQLVLSKEMSCESRLPEGVANSQKEESDAFSNLNFVDEGKLQSSKNESDKNGLEMTETSSRKGATAVPTQKTQSDRSSSSGKIKKCHQTTSARSSGLMKKRGQNKLVLSKTSSNGESSGENANSQVGVPSAAPPPALVETVTGKHNGKEGPEPFMRKISSPEGMITTAQIQQSLPRNVEKHHQTITGGGFMTKRGLNKLVLSKISTQDASSAESATGQVRVGAVPFADKEKHEYHMKDRHGPDLATSKTSGFKGDTELSMKQTQSNRGRSHARRAGASSAGRAAKRIKLSGTSYQTSDVQQQVGSVPSQVGDADTATRERLTEFPYRTVSQRGSGRTNVGLVRVEPDASKTPICPTFLRGVSCKNERCTKRHDVPKEAAMPVCSFFQRHGQCLKGEACPFRHIKVNPRATVCPSFHLLGFCEDADCLMKHVRQTDKKQGQHNRDK